MEQPTLHTALLQDYSSFFSPDIASPATLTHWNPTQQLTRPSHQPSSMNVPLTWLPCIWLTPLWSVSVLHIKQYLHTSSTEQVHTCTHMHTYEQRSTLVKQVLHKAPQAMMLCSIEFREICHTNYCTKAELRNHPQAAGRQLHCKQHLLLILTDHLKCLTHGGGTL